MDKKTIWLRHSFVNDFGCFVEIWDDGIRFYDNGWEKFFQINDEQVLEEVWEKIKEMTKNVTLTEIRNDNVGEYTDYLDNDEISDKVYSLLERVGVEEEEV